MMALEPRIMFDAAAAATATAVATKTAAQDHGADVAAAGIIDAASHAPADPAHDNTPAPSGAAGKIVFVDSQIQNYQAIVAAIQPGVKVVVFDGTKDGLHEIAESLAGSHDLAAIDIISHGAVDEVRLGTDVLNTDNLSQHADDLAAIGKALAPTGQIDLYGCDVAAGGDGFLDALKGATGHDVAASIDATGAAALGGNWTLEATTGAEASPLPADLHALQSYNDLLVTASQAAKGNATYNYSQGTGTFEFVGQPYGTSPTATATDSSGNIYITGNFFGSVNFGGTTLTSPSGSFLTKFVYVAKYNSSGALQWVEDFNGNTGASWATYPDSGTSIAVTPDGSKIYVGGSFYGTIHFDGSHALSIGDGFNGAFVVQLNSSGGVNWDMAAYSNGSGASANTIALATDSSGNLFGLMNYQWYSSSGNPPPSITTTLYPVSGSSINLGGSTGQGTSALIFEATSAERSAGQPRPKRFRRRPTRPRSPSTAPTMSTSPVNSTTRISRAPTARRPN